MHRHIIIFSILAAYYTLATYALYIFDAGLLATSIVLYGIPSLLLAHYTKAPPALIVTVSAMGIGLATLLESVAHTYGLWYSLGENEVRLLGVVPLEMVVALTLQIVFLSLAYEVLFDDGNYTIRSIRERLSMFVVFAVGALVLVLLHQYVLQGIFLEYSYAWIVGIFIASSLAMLAVHKELSVRFFDRLVDFALISAIPLTISLWLAVTNVHKVFANSSSYLAEVTLFGAVVPLEEMLLLFAIPMFVATVYELYLDDVA